MAVTTRTIYTCDRCGWDSDKNPRPKLANFGHLDVKWQGDIGGYGFDGACGGTSLQGKAYLCLDCTNEFLKWIKGK